MAIFRQEPPNGGVECRWGMQKSRFWADIWLYRVLSMLRPARCYQHGAVGPWQVVTLIAGSKRRSLLLAGDDDEMFMRRSFNVTPKAIEQHLIIVCSDKSVAYVTNNKNCAQRFVLLKLTMTDTKHRAASLRQQSYLFIRGVTTFTFLNV